MLIINKESKLEVTKWIEPQEGVKLLVGSIENENYRTTSATIYRHIDRLDNKMNVGTPEFDITKIDITQTPDDLLMATAARYLLKDWQGVGELNAKGKQVAIEYTPERGVILLKQNPEFYWKILNAAIELGKEESEHVAETVKKS
ncbi:TPA: hypothetical protein U2M28_003967 [Providencia stuartii]|uniref:hypothetical protein n=1 Tax=Providencia stuartii TaxID=588 RepID=UPI000DE61649|nr:hypothetical protein [Providencia stuartii]SST04540.1 Uncharacterised protein [Acinetobacter baumannii]MDK7737631.1 hypothetical protein [Providencia stuartii]MDT1068337.1 hypothetical protein [Providencia stuartii]HEM8199902.1 hypothetical protein [Providencia stuartii]HEM8205215.1 hypothetical protein [Providencia stuartii]